MRALRQRPGSADSLVEASGNARPIRIRSGVDRAAALRARHVRSRRPFVVVRRLRPASAQTRPVPPDARARDVERHEQGVLIDAQFRREDRCDAIRPELIHASRSARASLKTWAMACARSTSSQAAPGAPCWSAPSPPSLTVRACSRDAPPVGKVVWVSPAGALAWSPAARWRTWLWRGLPRAALRCSSPTRGQPAAGRGCHRPRRDAPDINRLLDRHVRDAAMPGVSAYRQTHDLHQAHREGSRVFAIQAWLSSGRSAFMPSPSTYIAGDKHVRADKLDTLGKETGRYRPYSAGTPLSGSAHREPVTELDAACAAMRTSQGR